MRSSDCDDVDSRLFAELLVLDLRDEGEVIDRPLTVSLSCGADPIVIEATDREAGISVRREIPGFSKTHADRERILALTASELLRVSRWTEPEPEPTEEPAISEIIIEEEEPEEEVPEPPPRVLPSFQRCPKHRAFVGIAPVASWRFTGDRLATFGAEARGGFCIKGPWWIVTRIAGQARSTAASLGTVDVLEIDALAGAAWRPWWNETFGLQSELLLGVGYFRFKGNANASTNPLVTTVEGLTQHSASFVAQLGAGPRFRFGRVVLGADVRLGLTLPQPEEAVPVGSTATESPNRLSVGLASLIGALTLDIEL